MKKSQKNILVAFILNFSFTVIEIIGGILTNSIAIISDAIHDFGDTVSVAVAFFLGKKAEKKADSKYTYGYARYSLISALLTNIVLIIGACFVVSQSIDRIINPQPVVSEYMIYLAIFGVVVNGIAALRTRGSKHLNERAISLHMLEDVLGWAVILIGAVFMYFFNIPVLDPILSLCVTVYIVSQVVKNLISVFKVLLEQAPASFKLDEFTQAIKNIEGIRDIHHVHIWTLDGNTILGTAHVCILSSKTIAEWQEIREEIASKAQEFNVMHLTCELEAETNECLDKECHSEFEIESLHNHGGHEHSHKHNHEDEE